MLCRDAGGLVTRLSLYVHNNPINKRHKKKKETQQKRRIPLPKLATPKQKNSLGWYHAILKTPNLAINTALKDLHDTTNETRHNNHARLTTRRSVNNPSTIKITTYPPQTNANPKSSRNHDISYSKPLTTPEPRPNYQPPRSNAITVEDLPNHQAQMQDSNAAQPQNRWQHPTNILPSHSTTAHTQPIPST